MKKVLIILIDLLLCVDILAFSVTLALKGLTYILLSLTWINNLITLKNHLHLAINLGELDSIGQEVEQHLLVPALVPIDILEVTQVLWVDKKFAFHFFVVR